MRVESNKPVKGGGWFHPTDSALPTAPFVPTKKPPKPTDKELHAKWAPMARNAWKNHGDARDVLAGILGVARWSLDELCIGWLPGSCWTIPEKNGYGLIVGISTRYRDGEKKCLPGSRRGLTYSESWESNPGPVLVVEGMSDVAAGITLGLATIGRPSNIGGVKYLTRLLGHHPTRKVVVIGERDYKQHKTLPEVVKKTHDMRCRGCRVCWPGLAGRDIARDLTKALSRIVRFKFLPCNAKDLRQWLEFQHLDISDQDAVFAAGKELAAWLAK